MAEYIERESVLSIVYNGVECWRIKNIPAANVVEVVHGEWVWDNHRGLYICSKCGALSPRENQDGEYIDCPAYCHECGAKMDAAKLLEDKQNV